MLGGFGKVEQVEDERRLHPVSFWGLNWWQGIFQVANYIPMALLAKRDAIMR